jgi:hypothetical protein
MEKAIALYQLRNLIKEYDKDEISLSRFTEILNEKAEEYAQSKIDALHGVMPIIGTRVRMFLTHNERTIIGTVIKRLENGKAMIRWDHDSDVTSEKIKELSWA